MKSNIVKYIFMLFAIFIIGFAIYKINEKEDGNGSNENTENTTNTSTVEMLTSLRLGLAGFDNLNPLITQNRDIINLSTIIYEPLLGLTDNYKIERRLADEWSKIDGKTYIIKLRENIKWEDGTKVTATDVKFTMEKLKQGKSIYSPNVRNVEIIEILDERTIRLTLYAEEPFFEYNLIFPIISSKQFSGVDDFFDSRIAPMATGMYKVKSSSNDAMQLVKNDNWYGTGTVARKIETIKLNLYSTMGDAYNSFKLENIDMLCTSNLNISEYIGTIGYTEKDYKGRELDFISLNCQNGILTNKEVRQAINYAIDKNNIISTVYSNNYYVSSFPLDYGNYLYEKESFSSYDQEKAKKVLQDAGWEYKYGRWQKTENYYTKTIYLNLIVEYNNKTRVKVAEAIKKQLANVGIQVSVYKVSNASYQNYLKNKNYDMILTGVYNGYSPNLSYYFGTNNLANYQNEEMFQLISEVNNITDGDLLKEKYNNIIRIYEDEVPYVYLYRNKGKVVYDLKLTGEFKPNNYTAYHDFYKWYRQY